MWGGGWGRKRASTSGGRAEREGKRIPGKLSAVSAKPNVGLKSKNCEIVTQDEIKSQMLKQLNH